MTEGEYMTEVERRRAKKRKKMVRNVRRVIKGVLLMPGKIPPIDDRTVGAAMKACETFGVLFVGTLIAHLISESSAVSVINVLMGLIFFGLLFFIKLAGYQDRLIREELSNFIYIR